MFFQDLDIFHRSAGAVVRNGLFSHYGSVSEEYRLMKHGVAWCDFSHVAKMIIRGDDRSSWFQGQTTNDVTDLSPSSPLLTTILRPTGQIVADLCMFDCIDTWLVYANTVNLKDLISRLESMIILEDVHLENISDTFGLIRLIGPKVNSINAEAFASANGLHVFPDPIMRGYFCWFNEVGLSSLLPLLKEIPPAGMDAYEILRLEHGQPIAGQDFDDKTLVMEMGDAFIGHRIHFDKGCYTGQEIVQRIYARGRTHRSWVGLFTEDLTSAGSKIFKAGTEVGFVTSSALSPDNGPLATAMVRNEAVHSSVPIEIKEDNRTIRATCVPLPFVGKNRPTDV